MPSRVPRPVVLHLRQCMPWRVPRTVVLQEMHALAGATSSGAT